MSRYRHIYRWDIYSGLEAPRPLEGSSCRQERIRPTEWSLRDESVQADLDLVASFRVSVIHFAAVGRREVYLSSSHRMTLVWARLSCGGRWSPTAMSWVSRNEQFSIRKGAWKAQILQGWV